MEISCQYFGLKLDGML